MASTWRRRLRSLLLVLNCASLCAYNGYNNYQYGNNNNNNQYAQNSYNSNGYGNNGYGGNSYGSNGYNSNGHGNNGYGGDSYGNNGYGNNNNNNAEEKISLNVCANSVVQVTSVNIACSSPYTFYYGNGAHRNSVYCDYLDKATVNVNFQVIDNIEEESDIYMTMAIRDQNRNLLAVIDPSYLCNDYVGSSCTSAGKYSFSTKVRLQNPSGGQSSNSESFLPIIQMAFSTKPNHGYNLGALNTACKEWDNNQPDFVSWRTHKRSSGARLFWQRNGALLGTCFVLTGVIAFVWTQSNRNSALFHLEESVYGKEGSNSMPLVA
jgi:hypothetical protein